jgi:hypothetical protein
MPRFKRTCSNPFHEKWSKREEEKTVSLRARGLVAIANVFEKYVEEELGKKSTRGHEYSIKYLCTTCLNECFKKRKFTKLLKNDEVDELRNKVERQVSNT